MTAAFEAIAELPKDLFAHFCDAVTRLDIQRVSGLIEQIRPQHPNLADALAELVKNYRFDLLLMLRM